MTSEASTLQIEKAPRDHQKEVIRETHGEEVLDFITEELDPDASETGVLKTDDPFNIELLEEGERGHLIDLDRLNDIRDPDGFLRTINGKLPDGGCYIGCLETLEGRKERLLAKFPPLLNRVYYFLDFVFRRVFPKLPLTDRFEFFITAARNRPMSKAEALGRTVYNGFRIERTASIGRKLYFVARKTGAPMAEKPPSKGLIIGIPRIGKDREMVRIYKFRTMHPYAQFLQDYVYRMNDLEEGGKFRNDFRITSWGRFIRKLWIDEWPMIYNLLRGDMKLVGVRPLSPQYFALYREELQELRTQVKPGLIPPFYVDMPKTLVEIMDSEERYLRAYLKAPLRTDIRYFFKAMGNILFQKVRTQ
jgi:lipopolysaccharide/colanic/teichoic acid biosynthesis glycosyltransferase